MSVGEFAQVQSSERPDFPEETSFGEGMNSDFFAGANHDQLQFPPHLDPERTHDDIDWAKLASEVAPDMGWVALTAVPAAHPETERRGPNPPTNLAAQLEAVIRVADRQRAVHNRAARESLGDDLHTRWNMVRDPSFRLPDTYVDIVFEEIARRNEEEDQPDVWEEEPAVSEESAMADQPEVEQERLTQVSFERAMKETRWNAMRDDPNFGLTFGADTEIDGVARLGRHDSQPTSEDQPDTSEGGPTAPEESVDASWLDVEQLVTIKAPRQPVYAREIGTVGRMARAAGRFVKRIHTTVHNAHVRFDN